MLKIHIAPQDVFDERTQKFGTLPGYDLEFEHSLASLSKWESQWEKPFMGRTEKTDEEAVSYIRDMCLTPDVPPEAFTRITGGQHRQIQDYISAKMTATFFSDDAKQPPSREIITAELLYYWMIASNIPFECQYWHLNKLLALLKVCAKKSEKPKKMSRSEIDARNRQLNAQRRARMGSSG